MYLVFNPFTGNFDATHSIGMLDERYVNVPGDTMTGPLVITPSSDGTQILSVTQADTTAVFDVDTTNRKIVVTSGTTGQSTIGAGLIVNNDSGSGAINDFQVNSSGLTAILVDASADTMVINTPLVDKLKFTQADGNEYIDSLNDGFLDIGATTAIRMLSEVEAGGTTTKVKITSIGGIAIKLTNTTGAVTVKGQTVKADAATDDAVILTGADDTECFGVFLDAGVADDAEAWVVVSGIADVAMEDNTAATHGNWVETSESEAGYADSTNASPAAAPQHFNEIGHCIESVSADGEGTHILARCVLHFN